MRSQKISRMRGISVYPFIYEIRGAAGHVGQPQQQPQLVCVVVWSSGRGSCSQLRNMFLVIILGCTESLTMDAGAETQFRQCNIPSLQVLLESRVTGTNTIELIFHFLPLIVKPDAMTAVPRLSSEPRHRDVLQVYKILCRKSITTVLLLQFSFYLMILLRPALLTVRSINVVQMLFNAAHMHQQYLVGVY